MASSSTFYTTNNKINWRIDITPGTQDIENNRTSVTVQVIAWRTNIGYTTDGYGRCQLTIDGTSIADASWNYDGSHALVNNTPRVLHSWSGYIYHNADGTKTLTVSAYWGIGSSSSNWQSNVHANNTETYSLALNTIPRDFSQIPKLTLDGTQKTETKLVFNWETSEVCDHIEWSQTASNVTGVPGTSGTVTFSSLTANTEYTIYGTFRRRDSQRSLKSTEATESTYDYPKITNLANNPLTIGSDQIIYLYNPLGRSCTVYMKTTTSSPSVIKQQSSVSATSTSWTFTSAQNDVMYNSIPNDKEGDAIYYCTCVVGGVTRTSVNYPGKYRCNENNCKPLLTQSLSYLDTNATVTALTGDDSYLVQNQSTCRITIPRQAAAARYGTTIKSYVVTIGGVSRTIPYGTNNTQPINIDIGTLNSGTDLTLSYYAIDNREIPSSTSSPITVKMIPWTEPSVSVTQLERQDGYSTTVNLNTETAYSKVTINNQDKNSFKTLQYQYKRMDQDDTHWSNAQTFSGNSLVTISSINTNYDYNFKIQYQDQFTAIKTISKIIPKGTAILMIDPVLSSVGVNCFPDANDGQGLKVKDYLKVDSGNASTTSITTTGGTAIGGSLSANSASITNAVSAGSLSTTGNATIGGTLTATTVNASGSTATMNGTYNFKNTVKLEVPDSTSGTVTNTLKTLLDIVYPIGSIYMSVEDKNPAALFGVGTWTRLENRFLIGASNTYAVNSTGGDTTHYHGLSNGYACMLYTWLDNQNRLLINYKNTGAGWTANRYTVYSLQQYSDANWGGLGQALSLGGTTDNATILPPYVAVYMWKRTS